MLHLLILLVVISVIGTVVQTTTYILQICTEIQWQYICAKPNSTFWNENEARVACYEMGCHGKKDQVVTNSNCYLTFYFNIELRISVSNSLNIYNKTFACSGIILEDISRKVIC